MPVASLSRRIERDERTAPSASRAASHSARRRGCARRPRARRRGARAGPASDVASTAASARPRNASAASRAPPTTTSAPAGTRCAIRVVRRDNYSWPHALPPASPARSPPASRPAPPCARGDTFVSSTTGASTTFVASSRPPSPASTTATSTPASANAAKRGGRQRLELRRAEPLGRAPDAPDRALEVRLGAVDPDALAPAAHVRREVRAGAQSLAREQASIVRVAVDLPFVPTTCTAGSALRLPELGEQRPHPLEPELLRPRASATRSTRLPSPPAAQPARRAPRARAGSGRASRAPPPRPPCGALRDEPLVREHPLGARDLAAQPLDLRARVAVRPAAVRAHDGLEDPPLVAVEVDEHAAPPEDPRRLLRTRSSAPSRLGVALVRLGPGGDDQPRSRGRAGATRSPRSRAASRGAAAASRRSSAASAVATASSSPS